MVDSSGAWVDDDRCSIEVSDIVGLLGLIPPISTHRRVSVLNNSQTFLQLRPYLHSLKMCRYSLKHAVPAVIVRFIAIHHVTDMKCNLADD